MNHSSESNIQLIRNLFDESFGGNNIDRYDYFFSHDVCLHGPASGEEVRGLLNIKKLDAIYASAFKNAKAKIRDIFSCESKVIVHWQGEGVHIGKYESVAPTNREFSIFGLSIYHLREGKINEIWQSWDRLGLIQQIEGK